MDTNVPNTEATKTPNEQLNSRGNRKNKSKSKIHPKHPGKKKNLLIQIAQRRQNRLAARLDRVETKDLVLQLLGDKSSEKGELNHSFEFDANLLQDLDLVILAAPLDDYKTYASLLRQEYASMSEDNYKLMRLKVLETLLIIPKIYSTPEYQTKFEEKARNNIKWEISELKA